MTKLSLLLVFGGESTEHEISITSAKNVFNALDKNKYEVSLCYIDTVGAWRLVDSVTAREGGRGIFPFLGHKSFKDESGKDLIFDIFFPVLHGKNGEDGVVQGLAKLLGLPCVGPSLLSAAVTMDKDMTKRLAIYEKIPVVPWLIWQTHQEAPRYEDLAKTLGSTLFVKPVASGSSVGVNKVTTEPELRAALDEAAKHDSSVLIEEAISAREIELAVLGNENPRVSGAGEIATGDKFYSYEEKYASSSDAMLYVPANISEDILATLQDYALRIYHATRSRGMSRVDFFVDEHDSIYLNEVNSIPGFTDISMYPKLWQQEGVAYSALLDCMIELALE
jgi:D-alanine-D-alanine ligase